MKTLRTRTTMVRMLVMLAVAVAIFALAAPDSASAQQGASSPNLTAVGVDTYVMVSWKTVSDADGYKIAYRRNDGSPNWHETYWEPPSDRQYDRMGMALHGLINGVEYVFKVTPYVNGQKPYTITATATPNGPVTQSPTLAATPGAVPGSVNLSWNAIPNAQSYVYQYKAKDAAWHVDGDEAHQRFASLKTRVDGNVTSATVENLAPGTEYTFRIHVRAGDLRRSDWSETDVWATTIAPTIHSTAAASQSVTLSWNRVPGSTGYAYQHKASSASNWSTETSVSASAHFATVRNLTNNTAYDFRVRSTGPGDSLWSDPVSATPKNPNDEPSATTQADVNPGSTAALFTWQSGGNGANGQCPTDSFLVSITGVTGASIPGSPYKVDAMSNPSYVYRLYVDQGLEPNESYTALITPYGCNTTGEATDLSFDMNGASEPQRFEELEGSDQMQPPFRVKNLDVKTVGFKATATWSKPKANEEGRCPLEDNVEYRWHLKNLQTGDVAEGSFESDADTVELALGRMQKNYKYRLKVMSYSPQCGEANGESKPKSFKWLQPESKGNRFVEAAVAESD